VFKSLVRVILGIVFFGVITAPAVGQERDFRRFFKPPETPREFWDALNFEVNVGRYDLAAAHLKGFLASVKDRDDELLKIEQKDGLTAFLRLRLIAKWSDNDEVNKEAKQNVEALLQQTTRVLKAHLLDPERIAKFTKNLTAPTKEERDYALFVLQQAGAAAVPHLVTVLRETPPDSAQHVAIIATLPRLRKDIIPPLVAALDAKPEIVRAELIDVLRKSLDRSVVPFLWYFSASPKQPELVRQKAAEALVVLTERRFEQLPPAKVALTQEADRYYRHLVYRDRMAGVVVWRWDENKKELASQNLTPTQAEEYYGTRFAREALDLDPAYEPAQVVLASLMLEKDYERGGLDKPLPPATKELLASLNPELLTAVLRQGLADHRTAAILGSVHALGDQGAVEASRSDGKNLPVLVRALNYPDRRVQMTAADALLRMSGPASTQERQRRDGDRQRPRPSPAGARIVEVLRRTLAAEPEPGAAAAPRVLVAHFDVDTGSAIARAVRQAGFQVGQDDVVRTGREVLRRLGEAADIDVLLIDSALPNPQLNYLIAQLRADHHSGLLPVLVLTPLDRELATRRLLERYANVWVVPDLLWRDPQGLKEALAAGITDPVSKPLTNEEMKNYAGEAMRWLEQMAIGEVPGYDVRPAEGAILKALRSDDLAPLAIEAAGRLPDPRAQRELAQVMLDGARNPKLRAAAAYQLAHHIQQYRLMLGQDQVKAIQDLFLTKIDDAKLKANVAVVVGSLRPDARATGERLKEFTPPPAVEAPPPPKEEK
jgi:CheY-like chemotaxis protein